jgi:phage terminase large subunit-like protein
LPGSISSGRRRLKACIFKPSWNAALIDEMRMFPNGSFDDQIDSLSRAFSHLIGGGLAQWAALAG